MAFGVNREEEEAPAFPARREEWACDFHRTLPKLSERIVFTGFADVFGQAAPTKHEITQEDVYDSNGGTTLSVCIGDHLIVASDTRHSAEYNINSRIMSRIFRIGDFFFTITGFFADGYQVYLELLYKIEQYELDRPITLASAAHALMGILYMRRFFPYYVHPCLSGFERSADGRMEPVVYSFDSIGSYERIKCRCDGTASTMVQPLIDSWVSGKNFVGFTEQTPEEVVSLVKMAFSAAAERDVHTKDYLEMYVVRPDHIDRTVVDLRKD